MNRTAVAKGLFIAGAAAALILSGEVSARADEKTGGEVHCSGINACKGQGACAGANNSCQGKNACKGQGYLSLTKAECDKIPGTTFEAEADAFTEKAQELMTRHYIDMAMLAAHARRKKAEEQTP